MHPLYANVGEFRGAAVLYKFVRRGQLTASYEQSVKSVNSLA